MSSSLVILVTAGSAGLGSAVARLFAQHGYRVVINYSSNKDRADALIAELSAQQVKAQDGREQPASRYAAIQADLADASEVRRLVKETYSAMGRIDVVLSNGGWSKFRDTSSIDDNVFEEDWDRAFNMNVKSYLWILQASKQYLEETEGSFITTASLVGVKGMGSSLVIFRAINLMLILVSGIRDYESCSAAYGEGPCYYGSSQDSCKQRISGVTANCKTVVRYQAHGMIEVDGKTGLGNSLHFGIERGASTRH